MPLLRNLVPLLFLLLTGCITSPPPVASRGEPSTARALLVARAERGPVPMVLEGRPADLSAERLAETAAEGVRGVDVVFVPRPMPPEKGAYLLVILHGREGGLPAGLCRDPRAPTTGLAEHIAAAWCEEGRTVAAVDVAAEEPTAAAVERALRRAMAALFPDNYGETYGLDLFGLRLRIGGTFGF